MVNTDVWGRPVLHRAALRVLKMSLFVSPLQPPYGLIGTAVGEPSHDDGWTVKREKIAMVKPGAMRRRAAGVLVILAASCLLTLFIDAASVQGKAPRWSNLVRGRRGGKSVGVSRLTGAPSEANVAYFIQISEATLTLFPRLLRVVWHPKNVYIVHFDRKIPERKRAHAESAMFKRSKQYEGNVHVMRSETVTYRGISMVLNLLSAMQEALDHDADWNYFINISGSDYPLVSVENQRKLLFTEDFLQRNRSFFSFSNEGWWEESKEYRFDLLYTDTSLSFNDSESDVIAAHKEQPIAKTAAFTFVAAEAWMILHREFVKFLLSNSYARRMLLSFSYSLEPEEHYFASVAYNNQLFNDTNVMHALRHVQWVHNGKHSGQHPYYIDQKEPDGKTWTFRDEIEDSSCFFARKIRIQDSRLLTYIDSHISGVAKKPNMRDVNEYLGRVSKTLSCLAELPPGDFYGPCFTKKPRSQ